MDVELFGQGREFSITRVKRQSALPQSERDEVFWTEVGRRVY